MKKLSLFLLITVLLMSACGNAQVEDTPDTPEQAPQETGSATSDDTAPADPGTDDTAPLEDAEPDEPPLFALKVGNFLIEMDQNINEVLDALGEPQGIFVAPSCAFDGDDRIFQYPSVQIHTYPKGDDDFVHTISLRDDTVRTTEGRIYLGSNLQSVLDAYGDDYEHDSGMYTYTRGPTTLEFFIEDDIVMGITYGLIISEA